MRAQVNTSWAVAIALGLAVGLAGCQSKQEPAAGGSGEAPSEPAAKPSGEPAAKPSGGGGGSSLAGDCAVICEKARDLKAVGCVEGTFEELDKDMDSSSCNDWEGAAATGMGGDPCKLFAACVKAEGISGALCTKVVKGCL